GLSVVPEMESSKAAGCTLLRLRNKSYRRIGYIWARRHFVSRPMREFTSWLQKMNRTSSKPLSVASPLLSHALKERVAEDSVRLSRPVKISNPSIAGSGVGDPGLNRGFANAFDHRRKRLPGKAVDEAGSARIDLHHSRRYVN